MKHYCCLNAPNGIQPKANRLQNNLFWQLLQFLLWFLTRRIMN